MEDVLARNRGWVALRGVIALVFGAIALRYPRLTLATLSSSAGSPGSR